MITLGVTGSLASGKSTVAAIMAGAGLPVFDADAVVHEMYRRPPQQLREAFPTAVRDGEVDRDRLSALLERDDNALPALEAITHPFVLERVLAFLQDARKSDKTVAVLDVPLLFESGLDALCDRTLVTTVSKDLRDERVAGRGRMSEQLAQRLLARQMTDADKVARADYVVDTSASRDEVAGQIRNIIADITTGQSEQGNA